MLFVGGSVVLLLCVALGIFAWSTLIPSKVGIEMFNRRYGTDLSHRQIYFEENGFVDSQVYASIPMTPQEFGTTTKAIGMKVLPSKSLKAAHNDPWWFHEPVSDVFVLDRTGDRTRRDYMEGHYDSKSARGYFHSFDD